MKNSIFIFGFGYTAAYLTKLLTDKQYYVHATSRDISQKKKYITNLEINEQYLKLLDYSDKNISNILNKVEYLLVSIPPTKDGVDSILLDYKDMISKMSHLRWLGYLSSTSVYGNHDGNWVDEDSPCLAKSSMSLNRLKIERQWLDLYFQYGVPAHIFRLAGIYGPGQSVLDRIKAGKQFSVYKPEHLFSRVHVEDIAGILYASMINITPGEVYNVCDDQPAASHVVEAYAAKLLGIPKPGLIDHQEANLSPMAMEFYSSNKKVSNKKLKAKLKYQLKYANYQVGLSSLLKQQK